MTDNAALLDIARAAAAQGADLLATADPGAVHTKGERDFVTELDIKIETLLRGRLKEETPDVGFLGEESTSPATAEGHGLEWVLDPIDGTSNFIHGLPLCAVSLALVRGGTPVIGVVHAPLLGLEYYAAEGQGAFVNGAPIAAGRASRLQDAIISIGDYAVGHDASAKNTERLAITAALAATVERVRMFGSAALDLVWVADGRTDGCVIMSNKPWDTAAGVLIAREGGAIVTDSDGSPHSLDAGHTIAANPAIAREMVQLLTNATSNTKINSAR
ncbi:inositol monophosphatase family protein [Nocardia noduli]|uniref:inositol monophosphatase family protein n=1 Tax=Nocardia noduli TaxID=2815722 RepID=UPI001C23ED8C|nr:inositol monophosphatase family protein [Nocardia noduli]